MARKSGRSNTPKQTRAIAAQVLAKVLLQQGSLARLLPAAEHELPPNEHGLLKELCYGTTRLAPRLQLLLGKLLKKPLRRPNSEGKKALAGAEVEALLLLGLYQLQYTRIPDHAAIGATVEAARELGHDWATALINGSLRNAQRQREALEKKLSGNPEFSSAHPLWLFQSMREAWGDEGSAAIKANNLPPPMFIRVNRTHESRDSYMGKLQEAGIAATASLLAPDCLHLPNPVGVAELPGFMEGDCSVQDESAQLAAVLLAPAAGERVLDACCAPGGKTCHLLELQPQMAALQALDSDGNRLGQVQENLERIGVAAELVCADAADIDSWWDGEAFDAILLDAPCSATGVIRRNPDIKLLRRAEDIQELALLQRRILDSLWQTLKPGGRLLYATCSVMPEENAALVAAFIADTADASDNTPESISAVGWGMAQDAGRQILPSETGGDGFYYALLHKTAPQTQ